MGTTYSDPYGSYRIVPVSGWAGEAGRSDGVRTARQVLNPFRHRGRHFGADNAVGIDDFPRDAQYLFFDRDRI